MARIPAKLRMILEAAPDDAMLPVGFLREQLRVRSDDEPLPIRIGTPRAVAITGIGSPDKLRRYARRWHRMQEKGERPPIRVGKNAGPDSHWWFNEADCWQWRRSNAAPAATPDLTPDASPEDVDEATVQHWVNRVTGGS